MTPEDTFVEIAQELADAAREATLPYFRQIDLSAETKDQDRFDPVTAADRAAEKAMRDILGRLRPQDAILGEEYGHVKGQTEWTWVLDPIDGTRGFLSGTPTWGVLIALSNAQGPVLGVIDQPYIGERFIGGLGHAELIGPKGVQKLRTRQNRPLSDSIVFSTFPEIGSPQEAKAFHEVAQRCRMVRYGMDCYAYGLLALGSIDLVIEAGLAPYDIQAPIAVVKAASGYVTNWQGGPAHEGGRVVAAATKDHHRAALEILSKVPKED